MTTPKDEFEAFLLSAKARGYVTLDQLFSLLPADTPLDLAEGIIESLSEMSIVVFESDSSI